MTTFALDTNVISYLLKGDERIFRMFDAETDKGNMFVIPPIAYYEIKRGLLAVKAFNRLKLFDALCRALYVGGMGIAELEAAAKIYADLRQHGALIEDADIFIAAFCLVGGYELVTNNVKHFTRIGGLKVTSW
jgi:predicted nucleic acid-binding protein